MLSLSDCPADTELEQEVHRRSGVDASLCIQCGKCTGGCPMDFAYDVSVNQIMRLIRAGKKELLLKSSAIWLCASCQTCTARCTANLDVAAALEALRHMAREEGYVAERPVKVFADTFLDTLERHGRVHEVELLMRYNLTSGRIFTDVDLAPKSLLKSKIHLRAPQTGGKDEVSRIVKKFKGTYTGEEKA